MPTMQMTDDELDEKLKRLFVHHQGQARAIERWELVRQTYGEGSDLPRTDDNLQDRTVREAVGRLRSHGWMILDYNDGRGRFLAESQKEYMEFRTRYLKPLRARAEVIKAMDKHALLKWPNLLQPSLFDLESLTTIGE